MRPSPWPEDSVNHTAPSGPATIEYGTAGSGSGKCEKPPEPCLPIAGGDSSVNQMAPSGPFVIAFGRLPGGGIFSSRTVPKVASAAPATASAPRQDAARRNSRRRRTAIRRRYGVEPLSVLRLRLEDDERDLSARLALVIGVAAEHLDRARPQALALFRRRRARPAPL